MSKQLRRPCYAAACIGLPVWFIADLFRMGEGDPSIGGAIMVGIVVFCPMIFLATLCACVMIEGVCEWVERRRGQ